MKLFTISPILLILFSACSLSAMAPTRLLNISLVNDTTRSLSIAFRRAHGELEVIKVIAGQTSEKFQIREGNYSMQVAESGKPEKELLKVSDLLNDDCVIKLSMTIEKGTFFNKGTNYYYLFYQRYDDHKSLPTTQQRGAQSVFTTKSL